MDKLVKYLCIIQARLNSSRLPAKIMLDLGGKPLIQRVYESVDKSTRLDKIVVATSTNTTDDIVAYKLTQNNIEYFRGDLDNVLSRYYHCACHFQAQNIIRVTADNPLCDGELIDQLIEAYERNECQYIAWSGGVYGLTAEVFAFSQLQDAYCNARNDFDKEHVTPYIKDQSKSLFEPIAAPYNHPEIRATIDTLDDYIRMQTFYLECNKHGVEATIDTYLSNIKKSLV